MKYLLLLLLCSTLFAAAGVNYSHVARDDGQSIHLLEVDPALVDLRPVKAIDNGVGREEVLSMAERKGALAGVNAGFFQIGGTLDGLARGALKMEEWIALPQKKRGAIAWSADTQEPSFSYMSTEIQSSLAIDGLNRERAAGEAIVYTPRFNRTTLTNPDGQELIIQGGEVVAIHHNEGSSPIPSNGFVLSIHRENPLYGNLPLGSSVAFEVEGGSLDYVVGGAALLISSGQPITDHAVEELRTGFVVDRHARTAVGLLSNSHWLFVVVDQTLEAPGMTIAEFTELLQGLDCTHALNLDGGGSSTMVYEGIIVNMPRGDRDEAPGTYKPRRVSDAILILPKKNSSMSQPTYGGASG